MRTEGRKENFCEDLYNMVQVTVTLDKKINNMFLGHFFKKTMLEATFYFLFSFE